jgi:hypothetical protein
VPSPDATGYLNRHNLFQSWVEQERHWRGELDFRKIPMIGVQKVIAFMGNNRGRNDRTALSSRSCHSIPMTRVSSAGTAPSHPFGNVPSSTVSIEADVGITISIKTISRGSEPLFANTSRAHNDALWAQ